MKLPRFDFLKGRIQSSRERGDWFRGDEDADVSLYQLINAVAVGQVDKVVIDRMVERLPYDPEDFVGDCLNWKEFVMLASLADVAESEKELSDMFKKAVVSLEKDAADGWDDFAHGRVFDGAE